MGRARDEAGNIWETDAQGNPVRLVSSASDTRSEPTVTAIPSSPQQQRENARNDRGEQRDDVRIGISQRGEERQDREETRGVQNKKFDHTMELKKAFDAMPGVKDYRNALPQFVQGIKTANTPQGDLALIYAYAKIMDPGSVVREGEAASVASADTYVGQKIAALQKQLAGTGTFSPEARENLRQEMLVKIGELKRAYDTQRQRSIADAQAYGIDPVRVVGQHDGGPSVRQEILKHWPNQKKAASVFEQDTVGPGAPGGLASGGDSGKSTPIPPAMQSEYEAYVQANRGRLDPQAYAQFRRGLDQKYGFGSGGDIYEKEAQELNSAAQNGGRLNLRLPPADEKMTIGDMVKSSFYNSTPGAALVGAMDFHGGLDEVGAGVSSLINPGQGWDTALARADLMKGELANARPGATLAGKLAGGATIGAIAPAASSLPRLLSMSAAGGGLMGGLESNDSRLTGATIGALAGVGGGLAGRFIAAPIAERIGSTQIAQVTGGKLRDGVRAATGGRVNLPAAPAPISGTDRTIVSALDEDALALAQSNMADAQRLGLPYSLADSHPNLRALAGSSTRYSPEGLASVEGALEARGRDQGQRAIDAIDRHLSPTGDIKARQQDLLEAGRITAAPYYNQAYANGRTTRNLADMTQAAPDPELQALLDTPTGRAAMARANKIAADSQGGTQMTGFHTNADGQTVFRESPNLRTLDMVKRGFDDIIESYRDPITGRLNLDESGRAIEGLRSRFVDAVDARFPIYQEARGAYTPYARRAEALGLGGKSTGRQTRIGDINRITASMPEQELSEFRRGYASSLANQVEDARLSANPYEQIYGGGSQQAKIGALFPEGADDFGRIYNLERDMAKTGQEVLGGSQTARRGAADAAFGDDLTGAVVDGAGELIAGGNGGLSLANAASRYLRDRAKYGLGKASQERARTIGELLLNTDPQYTGMALQTLAERYAAQQARNAHYQARYGTIGSITSGSVVPYTTR